VLRRSEEPVDFTLWKNAVAGIAFALDRYPLARCPPGDQIDPDVAAVLPGHGLAVGPVPPSPYAVDLEFRRLPGHTHEKVFEPAALLGFVPAFRPDSPQNLTGRHFRSGEIEFAEPV